MAEQLLKELLEVDISGDFRDFFIQNFEVSFFLFLLTNSFFFYLLKIFTIAEIIHAKVKLIELLDM